MIVNLKMKKSKQQCTVCLDGFSEGMSKYLFKDKSSSNYHASIFFIGIVRSNGLRPANIALFVDSIYRGILAAMGLNTKKKRKRKIIQK